jgi:hypothetical protein
LVTTLIDPDWLRGKLHDAWLKPVEPARTAVAEEVAMMRANAERVAASLGLRVQPSAAAGGDRDTGGEDKEVEGGLVGACKTMVGRCAS